MSRIIGRLRLIVFFFWLSLFFTACSPAPAPESAINAQNNSINTAESKHPHPATPANLSSASSGTDGKINQNAPISPDPRLTPGDALDVTREDICTPGYSKKVRDVPQAVKEEAYKEYGILSRQPREYEVDHLISLELGGSNSLKNLWPESYLTEPWNARVKDKLENKLHEMICSNQIDIKTAQSEIASDWIKAYQKYIGTPEGASNVTSRRSNQNPSLPPQSVNQGPMATKGDGSSSNSSSSAPANATTERGAVIGNRKSHIYHRSDCPDYGKVSPQNKVEFQSAAEAERAGFRLAGNCPR